MPSEELFALADQLRELKETKKYAEQELKEITEEIDRVDAALAERMISMETQNFTRNPYLQNLPPRSSECRCVHVSTELRP